MNLLRGDCIEVMKTLEDNSIDSIVSDPPYELGFMGKSWDNTGIAYNVEMWKECLRVLKPGGYLLSFGGSRTYHRMACAIEDAGFDIRDMIEWIYGSGFPKSHNVGKAYDKLMGNDREVAGVSKNDRPDSQVKGGRAFDKTFNVGQKHETILETKGTSEYEGFGTNLKPAHEPICMARKPLSEKTIVQNVIKWGTGAINIDGCRVEYTDGTTPEQIKKKYTGSNVGNNSVTNNFGVKDIKMTSDSTLKGRFPANFMHDGSPEVTSLFPESKSSKRKNGQDYSKVSSNINIGGGFKNSEYTDSGSAARFFYCAKAGKKERNNGLEKNSHPTIKPIKLMRYLCRLVTPKGGTVLDPFMGSGTTGISAKLEGFNFIGIELSEEYFKIAEGRISNYEE